MWWKGNREEPQEPSDEQQEAEVLAYRGPMSEQMFRVVIYMTVVQASGEPFAARYSMIVPDYSMGAFTDTLNANNVVYTVVPLVMEEWEREEEVD